MMICPHCGKSDFRPQEVPTMLALFTELPRYCPHCGTEQVFQSYSASEFLSGVSFDCRNRCGLSYAYLTEQQLLDAASANGSDLERMHRLSR